MAQPITYLMVRVDLDPNENIDLVIKHIESIERNISALTRIDVIETKYSNTDMDSANGRPIIYNP